MIAENGVILKEAVSFSSIPRLVISDIDTDRLTHDRRIITSFRNTSPQSFRTVEVEVTNVSSTNLHRILDAHPFVPGDLQKRVIRCREIFSIQEAALATKLSSAAIDHVVIGISGGLDSTLVLLISIKAMRLLGLPPENIHAFTLPGFGTIQRTRNNATKLCRVSGVSFIEVDAKTTFNAHFVDLNHTAVNDITFENVQARYRTEFFFNKANELNGLVVGTGDLTEAALGWSTFSGDHISHYHVNTTVPKTLVQYLIRRIADEKLTASPAQEIFYDILDTPISPELLASHKGRAIQKSENTIGPVELADFFLYPFVRFGMRPGKILYLANEASKQGLFENHCSLVELHRWLKSFIERFFNNQFKRTCFPEGPIIGSVSLSPRGDWRMPFDAKKTIWLEDLESMYCRLCDTQNA